MARTGRSFPSAQIPKNSPKTSATISGTITVGVTETDIVTGGKTLIITLSGDTWIAAGVSSFDLQRDEIIAGIISAQSETFGWNNVVIPSQNVAGVVRTSDTVVTITWSAFATYNISSSEVISVTVPQTALKKAKTGLPASPTFTIIPGVSSKFRKTLSLLGTRTGARQAIKTI